MADAFMFPSYEELWRRINEADDAACDGSSPPGSCPFCELVIKILRGGHVFCPECNHVNAQWHSCADWKAYDAGEIDLAEVSRRSKARVAALLGGTKGTGHMAVTTASTAFQENEEER